MAGAPVRIGRPKEGQDGPGACRLSALTQHSGWRDRGLDICSFLRSGGVAAARVHLPFAVTYYPVNALNIVWALGMIALFRRREQM
jgi:hypothetical protein